MGFLRDLLQHLELRVATQLRPRQELRLRHAVGGVGVEVLGVNVLVSLRAGILGLQV